MGKWVFRRLYVSDERRTLARMPNEGQYFRMVGPEAGDAKGTFEFGQGDLRNWPGLAAANVVGLVNWESFSIPVGKVDMANSLVTLAGKSKWEFTAGQRYFVENLPEALDAPGEWYLDRKAGVLSYMPMPGEDMAKVEVIAPVARQFITVAGDGKKRQGGTGAEVQGTAFPAWRLCAGAGWAWRLAGGRERAGRDHLHRCGRLQLRAGGDRQYRHLCHRGGPGVQGYPHRAE